MKDMPYFMTDKRWFEFDFKKRMFVLTPDAPDEAKESYEEYLKQRADQHQPFFHATKRY